MTDMLETLPRVQQPSVEVVKFGPKNTLVQLFACWNEFAMADRVLYHAVRCLLRAAQYFSTSSSRMSPIDEILVQCESRIGYQFQDRALLRRCLTHSSSAETRLDSNERLEFLGDAVLGLIICEYLFQLYPDQREGQLTQMKSFLVSRQTCARVARMLDLEPMILVGRGLQTIPESILSAVVESLIAGVYFDGGLEAARQFIMSGFREELTLCGPVDTENFKSQLQEYTQRELGKTPEYLVVEETGPDHAREFSISARIGDATYDIGRGRSKKEAEQQAARNAVLSLLRVKSCDAPTRPKEDSEEFSVVAETSRTAPSDGETIDAVVAATSEGQLSSDLTLDSGAEFGVGCDFPVADQQATSDCGANSDHGSTDVC